VTQAVLNPSVWGNVYRSVADPGEAFTTIRNGAGTGATTPAQFSAGFSKSVIDILWSTLYRPIMIWNLTGITGMLNSGQIALTGIGKYDEASLSPSCNIYGVTPVSYTGLVPSDYGNCGTTAYSSAITYANWPTVATTVTFTLNSAGLTALNAAMGVGYFAVCIREATYDATNTDPGSPPVGTVRELLISTLQILLTINYSPTSPQARVSGLIHRYSPGTYTLEIMIGGMSARFNPLVGLRKPVSAIPPPTPVSPLITTPPSSELSTLTPLDMARWESTHTQDQVFAIFGGHYPSFTEWLAWYREYGLTVL